MNLKENTEQVIQTYQASTRQGSGCGCFMTGCAIIAGLFVLMCVGSYFVTMHTSIPLSMLERAIESEGDVEIEGLRGTINSGFEVDSLTFPPEGNALKQANDETLRNELKGLKFKYNGFIDLARTQRVIINEVSVESAKFYSPWKEEDIELPPSIDSEEVTEELAEGLEELRDELENGNSDELKELRIDLVSGTDIQIIDPRTLDALHFQQLELKNFHMKNGRVVSLGDLTIRSDQLDLETQPSKKFADESVAWNLTGTVKPLALKGLTRELAFDGDFAINANNDHRLEVSLADGQIKLFNPHQSKRTVQLTDFSHGDYFDLKAPLVPSKWNMTLNFQSSKVKVPVKQDDEDDSDDEADDSQDAENEAANESSAADPPLEELESELKEAAKQIEKLKKKRRNRAKKQKRRRNKYLRAEQVVIEPGASFYLGETKFSIETREFQFGPGEAMKPLFVEAFGQLGDQRITAKLQMRGVAPFYSIQLQAEGAETRDVWSQLFYGTDFDELTEQQKLTVTKSMNVRAVGEPEAVDF